MKQQTPLHKPPKGIIHGIGFAVCLSLLGDLALFAALPVKADVVGIALTLGAASLGGSVIAFRFILSAVMSPVLGKWSDQSLGRLALVYIGVLAGIASFLLVGYGRSIELILTGIVVNALCGAALSVVLPAYLGDVSPPGKEGELIGVYATAGDIGSAAGPLFAYLILPLLSLPGVYLVCSALFGFCLVAARKLKKTPTGSPAVI